MTWGLTFTYLKNHSACHSVTFSKMAEQARMAEQAACTICFLMFTKSNMARHRVRCMARSKAALPGSPSSESSYVLGSSPPSEEEEEPSVKWKGLKGFFQHLQSEGGGTSVSEVTTILRVAETFLDFGKKRVSLIETGEDQEDDDNILDSLNHCDRCCLSSPLLTAFFSQGLSNKKPGTKLAYICRLKRLLSWRMTQCKQLSRRQARVHAAFASSLHCLSTLQRALSRANKQYARREHTIEKYEEKNEWTTLKDMVQAVDTYLPAFRSLCRNVQLRGRRLSVQERSFSLGFVFAVLLTHSSPGRSGFYCGLTVEHYRKSKATTPPLLSSQLFKTSVKYGTKSIALTPLVASYVLSFDTCMRFPHTVVFPSVLEDYVLYVRPECHQDDCPPPSSDGPLFLHPRIGALFSCFPPPLPCLLITQLPLFHRHFFQARDYRK